MSKLVNKLKKKVVVLASVMLALQPLLGLAVLPAKTFAATCIGSNSDVVINEIYVDADDESSSEFIELYNNSVSSCVDISGWKIQTDGAVVDATLPAGATIAPEGYYLIADTGWETLRDNSAWPSANYEEIINLYNTDAGIALVNGVLVIDAVGYGAPASIDGGFEGTPKTNADVVNPNSIARVTAGVDTNDNSVDFQSGTPTPVSGDATAPVITLTGANPQIIEVGTPYTELGATVTDNVDVGLIATPDATSVDTSTIGTYTVTYDAADVAGNSAAQVPRTVNVVAPVVLSPVAPAPTPGPAVVTAVAEVPVDEYYGGSSEQGEVMADTTISQDTGSNTENKDEQKEDEKSKKNIPLWGIIFLLILAGIGGYLFYSQSPEKANRKK